MKHCGGKFRLGALVACFGAAIAVSGCETPPKLTDAKRVQFSEEAANVFVAAYPAIAWSTIAPKLEPKHNLSTADARLMAAITTQAQVNQFLSTFSASLGVALPLKTNTTITTTASDSTTTTGTRTVAPQAVPTQAAATSAIADTALAPDLTRQPLAIGLDGASQLQLGTGIFQLAQILDNQITSSLKPRGYEAHLVTLQVNLQPNARNLPYDAYVNVSLLPASWEKAVALSSGHASDPSAMPSVIVYPLVISDAMESASVGRSLEVIRQAALQLSGIVSNVGLGASLGGGSNRLESIIGSDRNSLLTVGRVSDHTLRIRLGAMQQGSRELALVPRTHNVSVVVFTKADKENEALHIDKLAAITETRFVDVETGAELPSRRSGQAWRLEAQTAVLNSLHGYGFRMHEECAGNFGALDLLSALDRGDFAEVSSCLVEPVGSGGTPLKVLKNPPREFETVMGIRLTPPPRADAPRSQTQFIFAPMGIPAPNTVVGSAADTPREAKLRRLLARLMTLQADSRFSKLMIELTRFKSQVPALPPKGQFVQLSDDGKAAATVTLRGGSSLSADLLRARLPVRQAVGKQIQDIDLLPSSISVDPSGEAVTVAFPSPTAAALQSTVVQGTATHFLVHVDLMDLAKGTIKTTTPYTVKVSGPASDKGPDSPLKASTNIIVASAGRTGRVNITIGDWDAEKFGPLALAVSGADVDESAGTKVNVEMGGVPAGKKTVLVLPLTNLTTRSPVLVQAVAKGKTIGQPLAFVVEPIATRSAATSP